MNSRVAEKVMGLCLHSKMSVLFGGMIPCVECGVPVCGPDQPANYSTDLNHASMAFRKLSGKEQAKVLRIINPINPLDLVGVILDPLKLCEAMLSAVAGETP